MAMFKGLGKALDGGDTDADRSLSDDGRAVSDTNPEASQQYRELPLNQLIPFQKQPRRYFDPESLQSLATNIKEVGILQPLVVRPIPGNKFEIVAGERRFRAASLAELEVVPCHVREIGDREVLQISLVENLQREDINPYEETEAILGLLELKLDKTTADIEQVLQEMERLKKVEERGGEAVYNVIDKAEEEAVIQLFEEIGRFSWISFLKNRLPLIKLPDDIKQVLEKGGIEYTKALAISKIEDKAERSSLLGHATSEKLSLAEIKRQITLIQKKQESSFQEAGTSLVKQASQVEKSWEKRKTQYLKQPEAKKQVQKIDRILKALNAKRAELLEAYATLSGESTEE